MSHKQFTPLEKVALGAPKYIGSLPSIILHTSFFVGIFSLQWFGFEFEQILLILTTVVSLEAIYLSIFIQMTVNHQARQLSEVSEDVEDISEEVKEIGEDVEDIQENVEDISEDVEEISEEVEELGEEMEKEEVENNEKTEAEDRKIEHLESVLQELLREIKSLKEKK